MGKLLLDQYSLLHFASGVVAYFVGIPGLEWFFAHLAFEVVENTDDGMRFINTKLKWWPGGKPRADSVTNMVGDQLSTMVGWWAASSLDSVYEGS